MSWLVYRSKDYQKLIDSRKYAMKYRDAVASLVVQDVVDRDRGLYTCEASNIHGYATSTAALRIKGNGKSLTSDSNKARISAIAASCRGFCPYGYFSCLGFILDLHADTC